MTNILHILINLNGEGTTLYARHFVPGQKVDVKGRAYVFYLFSDLLIFTIAYVITLFIARGKDLQVVWSGGISKDKVNHMVIHCHIEP